MYNQKEFFILFMFPGGRLLHKSKTLHRDLNPVWDEVFTVPIEDPFVPITIKVN